VSTPKKGCKHTKDGVYIANVMYVAKTSTLSTPKMACTLPIASTVSMPYGVRITTASMAGMPKEIASVKEGHNEPLAKEGNNKPLAKDGDWLSTTMSLLPRGQLAAYIMQDDYEHLTTKMSDRVHRVRQQ
jgi:hypothetical protein